MECSHRWTLGNGSGICRAPIIGPLNLQDRSWARSPPPGAIDGAGISKSAVCVPHGETKHLTHRVLPLAQCLIAVDSGGAQVDRADASPPSVPGLTDRLLISLPQSQVRRFALPRPQHRFPGFGKRTFQWARRRRVVRPSRGIPLNGHSRPGEAADFRQRDALAQSPKTRLGS